MFSSFFGSKKKSKSSPDSSPKHDDGGFVILDNNPTPQGQGGGVYPSLPPGPVQGQDLPYPAGRPAPAVPSSPVKDTHFLQGVPFDLAKDISDAGDRDAVSAQLNEILTFLSGKMNIQTREYDFKLEKSILRGS